MNTQSQQSVKVKHELSIFRSIFTGRMVAVHNGYTYLLPSDVNARDELNSNAICTIATGSQEKDACQLKGDILRVNFKPVARAVVTTVMGSPSEVRFYG